MSFLLTPAGTSQLGRKAHHLLHHHHHHYQTKTQPDRDSYTRIHAHLLRPALALHHEIRGEVEGHHGDVGRRLPEGVDRDGRVEGKVCRSPLQSVDPDPPALDPIVRTVDFRFI